MLQELLSRISDRFTERRQVLVSDFETLVANVVAADGEEMDADQIAIVLESLGRTADDLAAAAELAVVYTDYANLIIEAGMSERFKLPSMSSTAKQLRAETELFRQRIALLQTIKEQPKCEAEIKTLSAELADETERFKEAQRRWAEKQEVLTRSTNRLQSKLSVIDMAIRKLFKIASTTSREPELLEKRQATMLEHRANCESLGAPSSWGMNRLTQIDKEIAAERASQMVPADSPIFSAS